MYKTNQKKHEVFPTSDESFLASYVGVINKISPSVSVFQRWSAMTLQNETLILDSSSTTTGSDGMNLVLRQGVLHHNDSYRFTLHVTDSKLDGEGVASIVLYRNMPPAGGTCHLRGGGEAGVEYGDGDSEGWRIHTLLDRVHFNCSGKKKWRSHTWIVVIVSFCFHL